MPSTLAPSRPFAPGGTGSGRAALLALLSRLDSFRLVDRLFRAFYRAIVYLIGRWLGALPGVQCVYVRRSLAKGEFIPFLSDVDLTVVTESAGDKDRVVKALRRMRALVPIVEPQSMVLDREGLRSLFDERNLGKNRAFLYRIYEARATWRLLHTTLPSNPLESLKFPIEEGLELLLLSELTYWHGHIIRAFTDYQLSSERGSYFHRKRLCWLFMKATLDLMNFADFLAGRGPLEFSRRTILRLALDKTSGQVRHDLLAANADILGNEFDPRRSEVYLAGTFSLLSDLYRELFELLSLKLTHQFDLVRRVRGFCDVRPGQGDVPCHSIDLAAVDPGLLRGDETIEAAFLTPQPIQMGGPKVLAVIVLKTLAAVPSSRIHSFLDGLQGHLARQGVQGGELEVNLVDHHGFLAFSVPRQFGLRTSAVVCTHTDYFPSLVEMIFDATVERARAQAVMGAYFERLNE